MRPTISAIILMLSILLGISSPARGQSEMQIAQPQVMYTFGESLTIEAEITTELPIQEVKILLQPAAGIHQVAGEATLTAPGLVSYTLDLSNNFLGLFADVTYEFQVTLEGGETLTSPEYSFYFEDNRWAWRSLKSDVFEIYWYTGDTDFGGKILNTAIDGLERIRLQVDVPAPEALRYYVYATPQELRSALQLSGEAGSQIAGHADPARNKVMVSLAPGPAETLEMKRQVPHELLHVLLYQKLGTGYARLPRWLNEGLASTAELFPNPDYPLLLEKAYERQALLPFASLCQSFPVDAANFQLAYAQASSFTWYLQGRFGASGIEALLAAYADGLDCEHGAETALGEGLSTLELDWRSITFNENPWLTSLRGVLPWLLIFALPLLPWAVLNIADALRRQKRLLEERAK